MAEYEYEYYSGSEIFRIRIQILFEKPLLSEYEYEFLDYLNKIEYEYEKYWISI